MSLKSLHSSGRMEIDNKIRNKLWISDTGNSMKTMYRALRVRHGSCCLRMLRGVSPWAEMWMRRSQPVGAPWWKILHSATAPLVKWKWIPLGSEIYFFFFLYDCVWAFLCERLSVIYSYLVCAQESGRQEVSIWLAIWDRQWYFSVLWRLVHMKLN